MEANIVRVPIDVDIIATIISPPICTMGIRDEKIRAAKPILEKTSNKIGYPTSFTTFVLISSMLVSLFK